MGKATCFALAAALLAPSAVVPAADEQGITWLVDYRAGALPDSRWTAVGTPNARLEEGALHLVDDSRGIGYYETPWRAEPGQEIVVEVRAKVGAMTAAIKGKTPVSLCPWRDGAPITVQVSDGRHTEGLVLFPTQAATFTDRFIPMDATSRFHTYRLVIRGTDMGIWVDGERKVEGQGAFWKPADSSQPFLRFGSTAKIPTGDAWWSSVRLGVRRPVAPARPDPIRITMSQAWDIPRDEIRQTRPYLYDLGKGLLAMSVAQGPDAFYEPYGLLRSTDAGRSWAPIPGLDRRDTTPLPVLRRPDGSILAMSRWTWLQPDGSVRGKTVYLNAGATSFTMIDNKIVLPKEYANEAQGDQTICERHLWNDDDGGATMVVWSRKGVKQPDGRTRTVRMSHLARSTDNGKTWTWRSTIGPGGEPAVVRLSPREWTAVIRGDRNSQMIQVFSSDGGGTWSKPVALEVGKVLPDLVFMTDGVLACSYGRPASCLMFSLDGGKIWCSHHVVSDRVGFNYTSIREIRPGRLLYVHDAPKLNALYIDVERTR